MPAKNRDMAAYMRERHRSRRQELLGLAGGCCVKCGSTENLEFDHVDPSTKSFTISSALSKRSWARILEEFAKCQLLCRDCHLVKSQTEDWDVVEHGQGLSGKRNCPCAPCRARKAEYMRNHPRRQLAA